MPNSKKFSFCPSFSITGNLRATIFIKKDDFYSFEKYKDLITDKERFNYKYKSLSRENSHSNNNSGGKLQNIGNPEKKHQNKSKSLFNIGDNFAKFKIKPKVENSNNEDCIQGKRQFIINQNLHDLKKEFKINDFKVESKRNELIKGDENVYFSGKKVINLTNHNQINSNSNKKIKNKDCIFSSSLGSKILFDKIEKPAKDYEKTDLLLDNNFSYMNKFENLTLIENLEECEIIDEIDENNKNDNHKLDLKTFKVSIHKKTQFSNEKLKSNLISFTDNNLINRNLNKFVKIENTIDDNFPDEIYNLEDKNNMLKKELFKSVNIKKDFYEYKKNHIESTNVPDKSFNSNREYFLQENSQYQLTNEQLKNLDYEKSDTNIKNMENQFIESTISEYSILDNGDHLNSVSRTINENFKCSFCEVENIKKNLFLTEEEFQKDRNKFNNLEKEFVDFLNDNRSTNKTNFVEREINKLKSNFFDNAINKVNLDSFKIYKDNKYFDDKYNSKNFDEKYSHKKKKYLYNENLNSLEYSESKVGDLIESKNDNILKGRYSLIDKFNKENNLSILKYKANLYPEVNLSKYKIYKQNLIDKQSKNDDCNNPFNSNIKINLNNINEIPKGNIFFLLKLFY